MELTALSLDLLAFLFVIAVLAGFIDSLAGGGGLLTIPALLVTGMPALTVLATNKLQGSMGTATAAVMVFKSQRLQGIEIQSLMLAAFVGSAVGTLAVQFLPAETLSFVIPLVLFGITLYFIFSRQLVNTASQQSVRMAAARYRNLVVAPIGFYDGMFGPGTGSFLALSGVSLQARGLIEATAVAKPLNFATNIASLLVFLVIGHIAWLPGLLMMAGQAMGAWLGVHCLFKINPAYLRWLVILMSSAMLIKYCYAAGWLDF